MFAPGYESTRGWCSGGYCCRSSENIMLDGDKDLSCFTYIFKYQCFVHVFAYHNSSCLYPTIITGPWKWWALHIDGGRHHSARSCYTRRLHTWEERVSTTPNICSYIVWIDIYCRYIIYNIHVNTNIERAVLSSECLPIQVFSIY